MTNARRPPKKRTADGLADAREAYARNAWEDAYQSYCRADSLAPLAVDDLEDWVWAAALTDRDDDYLALQERIYDAHLAAGDERRAARAAFGLGLRLFSLGEAGRASGWLTRAARLLRDRDCPEQGYLLLPAVHRAIATGDLDEADATAATAIEIGDRYSEADLAAFARNLRGRALLRMGRIAEGLTLLDEAMLAATAGALSPIFTGLVYCSVIDACQEVFAFDRCREWTAALAAWCDTQPQLVTFTGSCLVHRAEVMQLSGAWSDAIGEAERATRRLSVIADPGASAAAFYQQAEIHRLRGEVSEAEDAYRRSNELGADIQPGLALLRLAQGRRDSAVNGIRRALATTTEPARRMRVLPAAVEIMLADGAIDEARAAAEEIADIAASYDTEVVSAMADHARGAIRLAEGDPQAALAPLRRAFLVWQQFGAPYLAARIRILVGIACRNLGDAEGAALEFAAARSVCEDLGAAPDLARIDHLAATDARHRPDGLTPREIEVLRLVAAGKTNKAIAKELDVAEKTVDRHLSNIFTKIDVPSRAAATAYAYEHQLV